MIEETWNKAAEKVVATVQLRHIAGFSAVVLTTKRAHRDIPQTFARLKTWTEGIDVYPTGNPLGIVYDRQTTSDGAPTRFSLCLPTSKPESELARTAIAGLPSEGAAARSPLLAGDVVEVREFPPILAAVAYYRGPAYDLSEAYDQMAAWIKERPYIPSGAAREVYLAEPGLLGPDHVELELHQPVLPSKR
ncbi:MAG: GyrI-like domain-containing protein [Thermoleophilia bacterium]|nr:GyrI-like domain-containing protein [Thermoleophilia bacterium]